MIYIFHDGNDCYEVLDPGYEILRANEVWVLKNGEWFDINKPENKLFYEVFLVSKILSE